MVYFRGYFWRLCFFFLHGEIFEFQYFFIRLLTTVCLFLCVLLHWKKYSSNEPSWFWFRRIISQCDSQWLAHIMKENFLNIWNLVIMSSKYCKFNNNFVWIVFVGLTLLYVSINVEHWSKGKKTCPFVEIIKQFYIMLCSQVIPGFFCAIDS